MVSLQTLATVTNASDNDANAVFMIDERYAVLAWYRDLSYASDEYGCTSIPNIFHLWLVDLTQLAGQTPPNVPHVNIFGTECVPHWQWHNYSYNIATKQNKRYLLFGGGRYASASVIYRRLVIADITNPTSPAIAKLLEDTGTYGAPNDIAYDDATDKVCVVTSDAVFRCDTLDNILNYPATANLRSIPAVSTRPSVRGVVKVGTKYMFIWNDAIYNLDTGSITTSPFPAGTDHVTTSNNYVIVLIASTQDRRNKTAIEVRDPDTLSLIKTINISPPFFVDPDWNYSLSVEKDTVILLGSDNTSGKFAVIDIPSSTVTTGSLPQRIWTNINPIRMKYRGGYLVWGNPGSVDRGNLKLLLPDSSVNIIYDSANKRVRLLDLANNPVANRTAYIRTLRATGQTRLISGNLVQRTSDANGYIDISDLAGYIRIEA